MARKHPGVEPIKGRPGWYRIRSEVKHPKTGRVHEIDRRVPASSAAEAATRLASERAAWLAKRAHGAGPAVRRRLGDALRAWLAEKRLDVKASTASTYGSAVEWWAAILGDYWIDAVAPSDVREALAGAREEGDASETLAGRLRVLRTFAAEERCPGIVEGVRVKREVREDERIEDEGRGLTIEELRRLIERGPTAWTRKRSPEVIPAWRRAWALLATMLWTGMRFGEAAALEWSDVDLEAGTVRVRRAVWRGIVDHPKARASKREIAIPDELVDVLREHRAAMLRRQQPGVASALVFPSRRSTGSGYVTNGHARKAMLRALRAAGVDLDGRPAVHCLRHTWNNLVRQHASELVRQALIGHADEEIGARYSSVSRDEKRAAVASVVRLVRGV